VRCSLPTWARAAPHRAVYSSNATGVRQLWTWDVDHDRHARVTDRPTGVRAGQPTPDGDAVVWFDDDGGSEVGRFVITPFDGGPATPLAPDVPAGWAGGLSQREERTAFGRADPDGFAIVTIADGAATTIITRQRPVSVGGLSADGALLALSHSEHGNAMHPTVQVVDPTDGRVLDAVFDGLGNTIDPAGWSPVRGDQRLALVTDRAGRRQAEVWDVATGQRRACAVDLPGEVDVEDWWPDGSALLLAHEHLGERHLLRHDLRDGTTQPVGPTDGTVSAARIRPDGALWYAFESSAQPPAVRHRAGDDDTVLLAPPGPPAPAGRPARALRYPSDPDIDVHAFLVEPEGPPPHPLVVDVHGGPHAQVGEHFDPFVQAWVDHGFAVLSPNYRGSTGYGKAWQDAVEGDPGRPELIDVRAGRDHLVDTGIADPDRVVLIGASWGGYLTLLGLGTQPEAWSAGVATVPVADYVAAFTDESPGLQEFDRTLFGGDPDELPELYRERSPITYADRVRAPVLIITGANDTRCPRRQVDNYVAALTQHSVVHRYDVFEAGHGSMAVAENIRQQASALDFVAEHLGTPPATR
jgi:dienelactone hydrolase